MDDFIFKFIKKTRRKPVPGDYFYIQLIDERYYLGRVIRNDACIPPITNMNVIYIYKTPLQDVSELPTCKRTELLIPPVIANNQGWLKGYFGYLGSVPLEEEDVLPVHCFESPINYFCYNEYGERLPEKVEPCGVWGVASHATIELELRIALGIR